MFDVLVINIENRPGRLIQREVAALDEDLLLDLVAGKIILLLKAT
jgi:hypothetical protein